MCNIYHGTSSFKIRSSRKLRKRRRKCKGVDNKHASGSIYLADCGRQAGITPSSPDKAIIITDIINGANNSALELAHKADADASSASRTTMLIMEPKTSQLLYAIKSPKR